MSTYKINNEQLTLIKEMPFKLEKEIQNIVERNLQTLLGLDFIKTEFSIGSFRIDSLAFDSEKKSFVIIAVSYTHLDVYKRQVDGSTTMCS